MIENVVWLKAPELLLQGICFRARRTGDGQNVDGRRGVRGYIKLADKICNLRDITRESPVNWPLQRKLDYLDWAEKVVAGCRGCNPSLEQHFDAVLRERRDTFSAA